MQRFWNPLVCGGSGLPPNLLLSAKLLALWLMVHRGPTWTARVHLPFVRLFDRLGPLEPLLLDGIAVAFAGSFLLLLGLQDEDRAGRRAAAHRGAGLRWLLHAQLTLVYFGAGLNKLLDPDWRSGVYFEFWMHRILEHELYAEVAAALPPLLLSKAMCWFVIGTELALAIGFALPLLYRWVIPAGVLFHVGMLVFTGGQVSWLFLYVMCASYVAVAPWLRLPLEIGYHGRAGRWLRRLAGSIDVEGLYRWRAARDVGGSLRPRVWRGAWAVGVVLLVNPVVYAHVAVLLLWRPLPGFVSQVLYIVKG